MGQGDQALGGIAGGSAGCEGARPVGEEEGTPPASPARTRSRSALAAAGVAFVGMLAFESVKSLLFPTVTVWRSHWLTIGFSTIVATAVVVTIVMFETLAAIAG